MARLLLADGLIDLDRGEVLRADRQERLTPNERELLVYLAARAGRDISREELHQRVWGHAVRVVSRAVTLTVHRLRRKIEQDPDQPAHLATGQGGYRWVPLRSAAQAPGGRVVLVVAQPPSPGGARWLTQCADLARDHGLYLAELAPDRVVLAADAPDRAMAAARALQDRAGGQVRVGMAAGEAECLVDPISGRTLYGGLLLERALQRARSALPGQLPDRAAEAGEPEAEATGQLPARLDPFVGRERELDALLQTLGAGERALLLAGPPGVGKTRLAEELARRLGWGALWVPLDPEGGLQEALQAAARALGLAGVPGAGGAGAVGAVGAALAERGRCVLVLDGADGAGQALGPALARWRTAAPETALVVTARERLDLDGITLFEVPGLSVDDGLALLRARAPSLGGQALSPSLVEGLDGLPLALELIAPRLRILTAEALQSSPDRLLNLLVRRVGELRHRSMRSALESSWERLDEHERRLLVRATVFAGPFALDEARAVLAPDRADAPWFVDTLQSLCDRYLVQVEPAGPRFRLLQTVRAFAGEHASLRGDAPERHARRFAALGEELSGVGPPPFGPEVLPELERASRCAAAVPGWTELAALAALAHAQGTMFYGGMDASLPLIEAALSLGPEPGLRARLGCSRSQVLRRAGRAREALLAIQDALALAPPARAARLEIQHASVLASLRDLEGAREAFSRADALLEQHPDPQASQVLRLNQAGLHHARGAPAEGLALLRPLLEVEHPSLRAHATGLAGALAAASGQLDEAVRWLAQAVPALEGRGETFTAANFRLMLAETLTAQDRLDEAAEAYRAGLETLQRLGCSAWVVVAHVKLVALELGRAALPAAARWSEQAERWRSRCTDARPLGMLMAVRCELAARQGDEAAAREAAREARLLLEGCADRESLAHLAVHRGMAALARGDLGGAEANLALAEQTGQALGMRPHSGLMREARRLRLALYREIRTETD